MRPRARTGGGSAGSTDVCPFPAREKLWGEKRPWGEREVPAVAAWFWILLIVLIVLLLFGGVGYSRR